MTKPKCPLKFRLLQFEGGEECDPECAWCLKHPNGAQACVLVVIAKKLDEIAATRVGG